MGVYIKGMEMPKTCAYCRFIYADPNIEYEQPDGTKMVGGCCCCFTGNVIWNTKRDDDCPLGDVPTPHGRLIDADAIILGDGPYEDDEWCEWALRQYQAAPTIIEAEVKDECFNPWHGDAKERP